MAKICARGHRRSGLKEGPNVILPLVHVGNFIGLTRLEHERHAQRRAQGCMRRPPAMIRRFLDKGLRSFLHRFFRSCDYSDT